jgi:hypothetical protein
MNTKVLIFGTLFLLGNITLSGYEINREGINFSEDNRQSFVRKGVRDELEERLIERGLDDEIAEDLVNNALNENEILTHIKMHNYLSAVCDVNYDHLIDQMATRALFKKETDFGSYDTLIALTRDINRHALKKETLEKLSQVAMINKNLHTRASVSLLLNTKTNG